MSEQRKWVFILKSKNNYKQLNPNIPIKDIMLKNNSIIVVDDFDNVNQKKWKVMVEE